ncbi:MAG: threonine dehydrogenase-like Zn-dependent dehydrogenase, partial [Cryomorphaceae bacterium]
MDQLLQSLKKGDMEIATLPNPIPGKGEVLVRTAFSAISAGTEGKTVSDARKGYVAKAQSRKEEVAKVVKAAQTYGVAETYKLVMNKLESLQPLGYSLSGEVVS